MWALPLLCAVVSTVSVEAAAFPFTFVAALPRSASPEYRESQVAACTRVGLVATASRVVLSQSVANALTWDLHTAALAIASIPNASVASSLLQSCCSSSLWCAAVHGSLQCWTTGLGGLHYENYGWALNDTWTPVYTCAQPAAGTLNALPFAGRVMSRSDFLNYPAPRLVLDGRNLGVEPNSLSITVGDQPCTSPDVCHNLCKPCSSTMPCGSDKLCIRSSSLGTPVCARPCNDDATCPCGATCYAVRSRSDSSFTRYLCLSPGLLATDDMCARAGPWVPATESGLTDRVECDPPAGVYGQRIMRGSASPRRSLSSMGSSRGAQHLPARLRRISGTERGQESYAIQPLELGPVDLTPLSAYVGTGSIRSGPYPEYGAHLAGGGWNDGLLGGDEASRKGRRGLQSIGLGLGMQPGWKGSKLASAPIQGGYRYSSVFGGKFAVIVVVSGLASTGVSPSVAAELGLNWTVPVADASLDYFARLSPIGAAAFNSTPVYTSPLPSWTAMSAGRASKACLSAKDCPIIDPCTTPSCAGYGTCVYGATGACDTSSVALLPGELPAPVLYYPLPRPVAAVTPLIPPPNGTADGAQPGYVANPALRTARTFHRAIDWSPASLWYSRNSSAGLAAFDPALVQYDLSRVSWEDDDPLAKITLQVAQALTSSTMPSRAASILPWSFPFFTLLNASSTVWVSPNGYLRMVGVNPCYGTFGSSSCNFDSDYAGIIGPLVADYDPGMYDASEVWTGQFDASPLSLQYLTNVYISLDSRVQMSPTEIQSLLAAAPGARTLCMTMSENGLLRQPAPARSSPPNPAFSTHVCVAGDGSIRWRYGAVLGTEGYADGKWGEGTVVNTATGGPPNATSWLSGVRSLSVTWDALTQAGAWADGANTTGGSALPSLPSSTGYTSSGGPDFALTSTSQVLTSSTGVRPGGTVALCSLGMVACASPTCGGQGTKVQVSWAGAGCGVGFERLLPAVFQASRLSVFLPAAPSSARIECVFGATATPAQWVSYDNGSKAGLLECFSPMLDASLAIQNPTLTLRLQLVLPATMAAAAAIGPGLATGEWIDPLTLDTLAGSLGIGPTEGVFDNTTGMLTLPLPVHGAILGGVPGAPTVVAAPLTFAYGSFGLACGCMASKSSTAPMCDTCGVCGGDGSARDCAGTCLGKAVIDDCGVCSGGATFKLPNAAKDCDGVCFGTNDRCLPNTTPQPSGDWNPFGDSVTSTILLFAIIFLPTALCLYGVAVLSSWYWSTYRREAADARMLAQDPEALGLPAGLSDAQLARMPLIPYALGSPAFKDVPGGGESCPICMEDFVAGTQVRKLPPCGHAGHSLCFDTWFARATTCPVCRAEMRSTAELEVDAALRQTRAAQVAQERARRRIRQARTERWQAVGMRAGGDGQNRPHVAPQDVALPAGSIPGDGQLAQGSVGQAPNLYDLRQASVRMNAPEGAGFTHGVVRRVALQVSPSVHFSPRSSGTRDMPPDIMLRAAVDDYLGQDRDDNETGTGTGSGQPEGRQWARETGAASRPVA